MAKEILILGLILFLYSAVKGSLEEGYRNRTNTTFNPDNYKSLYKVSAPSSPDIHVAYFLPMYPQFEYSKPSHSLAEPIEIVINLQNTGISPKTAKAVLAFLANSADITKTAQTVFLHKFSYFY